MKKIIFITQLIVTTVNTPFSLDNALGSLSMSLDALENEIAPKQSVNFIEMLQQIDAASDAIFALYSNPDTTITHNTSAINTLGQLLAGTQGNKTPLLQKFQTQIQQLSTQLDALAKAIFQKQSELKKGFTGPLAKARAIGLYSSSIIMPIDFYKGLTNYRYFARYSNQNNPVNPFAIYWHYTKELLLDKSFEQFKEIHDEITATLNDAVETCKKLPTSPINDKLKAYFINEQNSLNKTYVSLQSPTLFNARVSRVKPIYDTAYHDIVTSKIVDAPTKVEMVKVLTYAKDAQNFLEILAKALT